MSRKYQSLLSKEIKGGKEGSGEKKESENYSTSSVWSQCRRVHALRGIYVCMALKLFEAWESEGGEGGGRVEAEMGEAGPSGLDEASCSDAYVAMCLLGHSTLSESLVYTSYSLGPKFGIEPTLGRGMFTALPLPVER